MKKVCVHKFSTWNRLTFTFLLSIDSQSSSVPRMASKLLLLTFGILSVTAVLADILSHLTLDFTFFLHDRKVSVCDVRTSHFMEFFGQFLCMKCWIPHLCSTPTASSAAFESTWVHSKVGAQYSCLPVSFFSRNDENSLPTIAALRALLATSDSS